MISNSLWLMIGLSATAAGVAGIVLPLVPTTPFLLLAAYSFARSSPTLHNWLLRHPTLGKPIDDWRRHRAISRESKIVSVAVMAVAFAGSVAAGFPPWLLALQALVLAGAGAFVLSRAGRPDDDN
ncbi:MAG TPA: YbaN family protein [Hyphomicrobium sp.]|mgnify:CR=1 FL=1|nr:YbaN family protein [Hyphomicrobium sp.]